MLDLRYRFPCHVSLQLSCIVTVKMTNYRGFDWKGARCVEIHDVIDAPWCTTSANAPLPLIQVKHYPADYAAPNVLSVAATSITTPAGNYWSMSNPEYLATWSDYGRCVAACVQRSAVTGAELTS